MSKRRAPGLRRLAALGLAGVIASSGVTSSLLPAEPANAESNTGEMLLHGDQSQFVYLEEGDELALRFEVARILGEGSDPEVTVIDPNGLVQWQCTLPEVAAMGDVCETAGLSGATGVWEIQLADPTDQTWGPLTGLSWNIEASNAGNVIPGRVFTNELVLAQEGNPDPGPFEHVELWIVTDAGYKYALDLLGYNGAFSVLASNAVGNPVEAGSCEASNQSYDGLNFSAGEQCAHHRLFFSEPAADLPASAPSARGEVNVAPPLIDISALEVDDTRFVPANDGSGGGIFEYNIDAVFMGTYWFEIDTNNNGVYTDDVDVRIHEDANGSGSYSTIFDGNDGLGQPVGDCSTLNARVYFDSVGETHVRMDDVEALQGGMQITRINGAGAPDSTLFWYDTTLITPRENATPIIDGTMGADSTGGVHGWDWHANSWGNERQIDNWAFAPISEGTGEMTVSPTCLGIEKSSDATETARAGDTVNYSVTATNLGGTDFTAENPAIVSDDLTGVLDDATFNDDATADRDGELFFDAPRLTWSGTLAMGESVTLNYSVELTEGGDSNVKNVAFAGTELPACDPAVNGRDEATGVFCDVVNFSLSPRAVPAASLEVDKSANPASGTIVDEGQTVTYTLEFANTSSDPAAEAIAIDHVDHLADVLDDATLVSDPTVSKGSDVTATVEGSQLLIAGTLAHGETATVTYAVQVKPQAEQGNHALKNVVVEAGQAPTCDAEGRQCTQHPTALAPVADGAADSPLATTGGAIGMAALLATALLAAGGITYLVSRRRKAAL